MNPGAYNRTSTILEQELQSTVWIFAFWQTWKKLQALQARLRNPLQKIQWKLNFSLPHFEAACGTIEHYFYVCFLESMMAYENILCPQYQFVWQNGLGPGWTKLCILSICLQLFVLNCTITWHPLAIVIIFTLPLNLPLQTQLL
jgi:hypothetical protein